MFTHEKKKEEEGLNYSQLSSCSRQFPFINVDFDIIFYKSLIGIFIFFCMHSYVYIDEAFKNFTL